MQRDRRRCQGATRRCCAPEFIATIAMLEDLGDECRFSNCGDDVQGRTNAAGAWMRRSGDVQGRTNAAGAWMRRSDDVQGRTNRLVEIDFAQAQRITLVMDNLNTHCGASLYNAFEAEVARGLLKKLEFVYTPKHGSWLNIAECEFSVLGQQCFSRRLGDIETVQMEVNAWTDARNLSCATVNWRFTTEDARIKLKSLYPSL